VSSSACFTGCFVAQGSYVAYALINKLDFVEVNLVEIEFEVK